MAQLTPVSKVLIGVVVAVVAGAAIYKRKDQLFSRGPATTAGGSSAPAAAPVVSRPRGQRPVTAALSQWPGHMALVVGNGGLTTQPGSAAAEQGLDLKITFIEDAPSKNKALVDNEVDFIWTTVDEMPINIGTFRQAHVEVKAFVQIDWSRGGDACVASEEVRTVEDIRGRKSAVLMFSPDHTVFEFMLTNSRLTPDEAAAARRDTSFSMDDFTYARTLFTQKKIDVACLWEPDVTLALASRPGSHRLFSTADATDLVADILLVRKDFLDEHPQDAEKVARTWFGGVKKAEADRAAAARLISTVASRFRDELGYEKTLAAFSWVKWTDLSDNVTFFGLDGQPPSFDRVYNQADGIWINYPQAQIKDRFAPITLRDDSVVRKIWQAAGKPLPVRKQSYESAVAKTGNPLFTKPVTINFRSDEAQLDTSSMALVNSQLLPQIQIARGMLIRVEGNTDNVGDAEWNRKLSKRRAQAIVDYLVSRGIEPSRLVARGNGPNRPIASNKTPEGRARNRRTDILFIPSAHAQL
jgi:outer membrane protein OmpA-like peptidoglycan-associated protein/ABC-type nitrate/sulfonate/bicarbonate transport system substrate-binding protein